MTDMRNNLFNVETLSLIMSKKDRHNGESNGKPKELYIELAKIIGLFPDETPSGILNSICDVPHFSGSYESVLSILSIKIRLFGGMCGEI